MSIFAFGIPAEAAAANIANVARPLLGLGVFAALVVLFKPLIAGVMRAALLVISPRKSLQSRKDTERMHSVKMLTSLARDVEKAHPSLAAELRFFASHSQ